MPTVQERDQWRIEALEALYTATGGRPKIGRTQYRELLGQTSISDEYELLDVCSWLVDHNAAEWLALGGTIGITRLGVDQVEAWQREESEPPPPSIPPSGSAAILNVVEIQYLERVIGDLRAAVDRGEGPDDPEEKPSSSHSRRHSRSSDARPSPTEGWSALHSRRSGGSWKVASATSSA